MLEQNLASPHQLRLSELASELEVHSPVGQKLFVLWRVLVQVLKCRKCHA